MKNDIILETERLYLRKMTYDDLDSLRAILCDPEVMYAYEHAFDDDEVNEWLENSLNGMRMTASVYGLSFSKPQAR